MLFSHIDDPHLSLLLPGPIWAEAFNWIRANAATVEDGIYPIRGEDILVNVHGYTTQPRENGRFESHRQYLDLQYMIEGEEIIDLHPTSDLRPDGPFDEVKDLQFHQSPSPDSPQTYSLPLQPGNLAIFLPNDAHRPRVQLNHSTPLRKLVVKIRLKVLP